MDVNEFLFILMILAYLGIFLAKVYNIFTLGKFYDFRMVWILFIGSLLSWGIAMVIKILSYETLTFIYLHNLMSWGLALHVLFLIVEIFFYMQERAAETIQAYDARTAYGLKTRR